MINRESKRLLHCKKVEEGREKKEKKKKACSDQKLLLSSSPRSQHMVISSKSTGFRPAPFQTLSIQQQHAQGPVHREVYKHARGH